MGFLDRIKPKYKHSDWRVRLDAIKDITSERTLTLIVEKDDNSLVRMEAFKAIKEDVSWAYTAWVKLNADERKRLIDTVTWQELLKNISMSEKTEPEVCMQALNQITDQKILRKIAKTDAELEIRFKAIDKITDEQILAELASLRIRLEVRLRAVGRITDNELLEELAKSDTDLEVRLKAAETISDDETLANLAKSDTDLEVRLKATEGIENQKLLMEIAGMNVTKIVKKKPSRSRTIYERVKDDSNITVCRKAASMIEDENAKKEILEEIDEKIKEIEEHMRQEALRKEKKRKRKEERIARNRRNGIKCPNCGSYDMEWSSSMYIGHLDMYESGYRCNSCYETYAEFLIEKR